MADVLLELGRTDFETVRYASFSPIEDFVTSWENPAVGIISPSAEIRPEKAKVLARIRAISALQRAALLGRGPLSGLSASDCKRIWDCFPSLKPFDKREFEPRCTELHPAGSFTGREGNMDIYPLPPDRANWPKLLHGYLSTLGSFQLGSLSDFFKKISSTVTSPMGVSMLGAAAGLIPFGETTGKIASVALSGLTRYSANKYDIDPKLLAQQVASMTSLGAAIGGNPEMAQAVSKYLGVKYDPKVAQDPVMLTALLLKGAGQFTALNELAKGAGKLTGLFGPEGNALLMRIQAAIGANALAAGRSDVLSSGTAAGIGSTVQLGLSRGMDEFPIVPVVIGVGTIAVVGIIVAVAAR